MEDQYAAQLNEARNQTNFRQEEVGDDVDDVLVDGEALTEDELNDLRVTPPAEPLFPIFVFGLAVGKDLFDFVHAGLLGWLTGMLIGGIIWIWLFGKLGMVRKFLLRRLIFAAITLGIVAVIPGVNVFIPEATIFVLLAHHREKQIVKQFFKALEQIEKVAKVLKYA